MFAITDAERAAIAGAQLDVYGMLEAQDPDLAWKNFSIDLSDDDWFNSVTLHDDIDANAMSMSASVLRDTNGLSLAPLLESSTLNRDSSPAYAPFLDLVRMWRVSVCVVPHGDPVPTFPTDYHEIGKGYLDRIQVNDVSPTIDLNGRGEEALIIDTEILEEVTYSVGDADDMETVIQALLDDNMGAFAPTLFVPVATGIGVKEYKQQPGNLMSAITTMVTLRGWVARYRYDPSDGVNKFTLFLPDREAAEGDEDWEMDATEYLRLPRNSFDIQGVRNYIPVTYKDEGTGVATTVLSPIGGTSDSITRYRIKRSMPIDLGEDTQITTGTAAQGLADAVRSDLEWPKLEQEVETFAFWPVQLTDWCKLINNGVHY